MARNAWMRGTESNDDAPTQIALGLTRNAVIIGVSSCDASGSTDGGPTAARTSPSVRPISATMPFSSTFVWLNTSASAEAR